MPLYTPTIFTNNISERSIALFNKREQGIAGLYKKRVYYNKSTGAAYYVPSGMSTSIKFGASSTGILYDTDGADYGDCVESSGGHDIKIIKPSWATYGIVNCTIIFPDYDFTSFSVSLELPGSSFASARIYPATDRRYIKLRGIVINDVRLPCAATKDYGDAKVYYKPIISVLWY